MKGCCNDCGHFRELENNGQCRECNHKPAAKKKPTPLKFKPRKATGELELFRKLHQERGNNCQKCGRVIYGFNPANYHHIKPKGKYPKLKLDPTNIIKICFDCHFAIHNK